VLNPKKAKIIKAGTKATQIGDATRNDDGSITYRDGETFIDSSTAVVDALKATLGKGRKRTGTATTLDSPAGGSDRSASAPAPAKKRNLGSGAVASPQGTANDAPSAVDNTATPDESQEGWYAPNLATPVQPALGAPSYSPIAGELATQLPAGQLPPQGPGEQIISTQGTSPQDSMTEPYVAHEVVAESPSAEASLALASHEPWKDWMDWSAFEQ
jgi:hypothetical protein